MISLPRLAQRLDRSRFALSRARITTLIRRGLIVVIAAAGGVAVLASSAIAQVVLRQGDEGAEVTRLQTELQRQNFYDGPITGFYGGLTEQAVIQLQLARGLEADGIYGAQTQAALFGTSSPISNPPRPPVFTPPSTNITPIPFPNADNDFDVDGDLAQVTNSANASCALFVSSDGFANTGTLQRGDTSSEVRALQDRLNSLGFNSGTSDGVFGPATEAAVVRFQLSRNLVADGVAGGETLRQLGLSEAEAGQPAINEGPYAVVVPAGRDDTETLTAVRREVRDACFARSRMGSYIYAGGKANRGEAESLSLRLRSLGLDSRVDFRRRVRAN
ncbi:MAG: peptidoglycan-binding domain-containing protein [Elainellaceae cyanobacterium]